MHDLTIDFMQRYSHLHTHFVRSGFFFAVCLFICKIVLLICDMCATNHLNIFRLFNTVADVSGIFTLAIYLSDFNIAKKSQHTGAPKT